MTERIPMQPSGDQRLAALLAWVRRTGRTIRDWSVASADASSRRYFRLWLPHGPVIVMDAPPDKEDSSAFVRIAGLLRRAGVNAPRILEADLARGFLLLDDLGHRTMLDGLHADEGETLMRPAIDALLRWQAASRHDALPAYSEQLLRRELTNETAVWVAESWADLEERISYFERAGDLVAAQRIEERTTFDIEMMRETGYCSGIENYSVHLSERESGDPPFTLLDYFPDDFLTVVDESHQTLPQIRGQFEGDRSRKDSLVENGFRLPTAFDNRPLTFDEFEEKTDRTLYVSATPGEYEREQSGRVVEQIVRPTYLVDPAIEVANAEGQVSNLIERLDGLPDCERALVTTLTKRMAEDLTDYLQEAGVDVAYMHDETDTLERHEIIRDLRLGNIDVLVGINLLREGLDIPEVSLVAILDADQEGFLRSTTTLVQTMGRAARNVNGEVVLYADETTDSMEAAIEETQRRREIQLEYNEEHGYEATTIDKPVSETNLPGSKTDTSNVSVGDVESEDEAKAQIEALEDRMDEAASNLEFELAADIRDRIAELRRAFELDAGDEGVPAPAMDE